jgi:hypothetical protein
VKFRDDEWLGNKWASIDIEPVDVNNFLPVLLHLSDLYGFPVPSIDHCLDAHAADFKILNSKATIHIDCWTFSIAFEETMIRDQVLIGLQTDMS